MGGPWRRLGAELGQTEIPFELPRIVEMYCTAVQYPELVHGSRTARL